MIITFTESSEGEFRLFYIDRMLAWLHAQGIKIKRDAVERGGLAEPSIAVTVPAGVPTSALKEAVEVGCRPHNPWWKRRVMRCGFFFTEDHQ